MKVRPHKAVPLSKSHVEFMAVVGDGATLREIQAHFGSSVAPVLMTIRSLVKKEALEIV